MYQYTVLCLLLWSVFAAEPELLSDLTDANPEMGNLALKVRNAEFTQPVSPDQMTLDREHELQCWTCYTLDTLSVNTELCNKTLCTGKAISACYKWFVKYGFKKYRIYRGCMDNYTEIDYTNAMCKGTGLPLNETCIWSMCDTDYCNAATVKTMSFLLIVFLAAYWVHQIDFKWPN